MSEEVDKPEVTRPETVPELREDQAGEESTNAETQKTQAEEKPEDPAESAKSPRASEAGAAEAGEDESEEPLKPLETQPASGDEPPQKSQMEAEILAPSLYRLYFNTFYGFLLSLSAGFVYQFSLYSPALRVQMGFTNFENSYVFNFGVMGYSVAGVFAGILVKSRGMRFTLGCGAILGTIGYGLASLAVGQHFACPAPLFWFLMFLGAVANGCAFVCGVVGNTQNWPVRRRGVAVGATMSVFALCGLFYSTIWKGLFIKNPAARDYSANNIELAGFFWFVSAFVCGITGIGALVYRVWGVKEATQEAPVAGETDTALEVENPVSETITKEDVAKKIDSMELWEVLPSKSYLIYLFTYMMFKGVDKTYLGDIGKIGRSLDMYGLVSDHIIAIAVLSFLMRIISGFVIDRLRGVVPLWVFVEICFAIVLTTDFFIIFFLDSMYKYFISSIGHALASGFYSIATIVCANRFGKQNMGVTFSSMVTLGTVATFLFSGWNSAIYANVAASQPPVLHDMTWQVPSDQYLTINKLDTVKWTWSDSLSHSLLSTYPPLGTNTNLLTPTGVLPPGSDYNFTFPDAGSFAYFCEEHKTDMKGVITVSGSKICRGIKCYQTSFAISASFLTLMMILFSLLGRDSQHQDAIRDYIKCEEAGVQTFQQKVKEKWDALASRFPCRRNRSNSSESENENKD